MEIDKFSFVFTFRLWSVDIETLYKNFELIHLNKFIENNKRKYFTKPENNTFILQTIDKTKHGISKNQIITYQDQLQTLEIQQKQLTNNN